MAASAADVRSALSIQTPSTSTSTSQKKQAAQPARKPEGISRELYSLIGPSAPSITAQLARPRLKQKPNLGGGGKVRWERRAFKNIARTDSLEFYHWVKAATDPNSEYPFAKYNIQPTTWTYSQDEYNRLLQDKDWTKEETDYLFSIVQEYDIRWYVIHDRYAYPGSVERSMEDLKDRYYGVCRKLTRDRPWTGDDASKAQLMASLQFDKDREVTRKKYINSLENRTPEHIAEEEALYIEIKRLEQNERKFKRDREDLLRLLAGIDSGLPDIVEDEGIAGLTIDVKKKKTTKGNAMDVDSPATPSAISAPSPAIKRPPAIKNPGSDAMHCIIRTDPATTATKAAHQPAYLRSYKLPIPKAAIAPKVTQALAELGISLSRLVMPTRENCRLLEELVDATTALIDHKRIADKLDFDIRIAKTRLEMTQSQDLDGDADADGETTNGDNVDVDETADADAEGDDGRATSVVSSRSTGARSRKHSRRSMSISSVDTSANTVRGVTKRQKRG